MTSAIDGMGGLSPLPPPARTTPAPQAPERPAAPSGGVVAPPSAPSFAAELQSANGGLQFSKHALERVQRRGIDTGPATMGRLGHGVDLAARKGAREAVVMVGDTAFVVGVRNRTVITAVDSEHMRDHVFTNIDSAVIA